MLTRIMRIQAVRSLAVPALAVALALGIARAEEEPADAKEAAPAAETAPALLYLGLNDKGAEEWFRMRDHAVVIRVPGGDYARRPYEGGEAGGRSQAFPVKSFFIDKHEVTNGQFARFLDATDDTDGLVWARVEGIERRPDGTWAASLGKERHPVTAATGDGALAYAAWVGGRVPRRPEWEKAASGPDGLLYPWGDARPDATRANFGRPKPTGPMQVGSFPQGASPYGVLDMAGNVYDRVLVGADAAVIKGGSWASPHPLNLRVLDMCVQDMRVADGTVGFRCAMSDPEPDRPTRSAAKQAPVLRVATDFDAGVAEAKKRRVPIFLTLLIDTCGQCDRTRAQLFRDPRFVAYCNANLVVILGHDPGDAFEDPHPPGEDGACPLYPGLTCTQHLKTFGRGVGVVGRFDVSPGNFVLHPDRVARDAGAKALLVAERELPKWGNPVEAYLRAFDGARKALRAEDAEKDV